MRPRVNGKFLSVGGDKLLLRGVTYGTFRPGPDGCGLPSRGRTDADFAAMAAAGVNTVRLYTPPPEWLLDTASEHAIRVLAGLPWEQHVAFLDDRDVVKRIEKGVREGARTCAGHPALLGFTVGNEIPAPIARWHGPRPIEHFIERLFDATKDTDPDALVSYVSYPTTEYLQLPFLDFACFNVYLEGQRTLERYIARLHNLIGDRPLVMTELGLDSLRNGQEEQARTLAWQLESAFDSGCAGAYVFGWTDEWHRGGYDVDDWDFGLVDRDRRPKPALGAVSRVYHHANGWGADRHWPRITVAVCTYNGARWLPGCLDALARLDYPDWEVIVVSDGSTDGTDAIAAEYGVRLIRTDHNEGLANARNSALSAADGEIVAYLDDDARPEADWLRHLALAFERGHAAVGGPNIPPDEDGPIAKCVAASPGGPIHVLTHDDLAEHVPGCNMAFRRDLLVAIGGFDARFRIAGDDVDVCWRVHDAGETIGFSPAALVWHHRRPSVRAYLRQQHHYGKAEGLLHQKWPERYNRFGHLSWSGSVYGGGASAPRTRRTRVRYGTWGNRLFQSVYTPADGHIRALPRMPEWYLLLALLALLTALGFHYRPLLLAGPFLAAGLAAIALASVHGARTAMVRWRDESSARRLWMGVVTALLHAAQPVARLSGRLRAGLSPWRRGCTPRFAWPVRWSTTMWSESWTAPDGWVGRLEDRLGADCHAVTRGSEFDRWDLEVRGGALGVMRILAVIEEHGGGRQLARFRAWPRISRVVAPLVIGALAVAGAASLEGAWLATLVLGVLALATVIWTAVDCAAAAGTVRHGLGRTLADDLPVAAPSPVRQNGSHARRPDGRHAGVRPERTGTPT